MLVLLEYEIPRESRRPDALLIGDGVGLVIEFKAYATVKKAFTDQVFAYARDLNSYHRELENTTLKPVLALGGTSVTRHFEDGVLVANSGDVGAILVETFRQTAGPAFDIAQFLDADAYRPLPTLVRAARELFAHRPLPMIKRAAAATDPAVQRISEIAHEAAKTRTRHLLLVSGVPGSGKTLVGLRAVHAGYLDDLAVPRANGRSSVPAVFLSGNGPLVQVLQDALRSAGGGGKVFVRGVKDYVKYYSSRSVVPPEHLLVSDEAQRAWDADQVAAKHQGPNRPEYKSEPELFISFAERIPDWCVFVGLIGTGQEIHVGEEGGIVQWRHAVERCSDPRRWTVHAPAALIRHFNGSSVKTIDEPELDLNIEIRYHLTPMVHGFVEALLNGDAVAARPIADELRRCGFRLLLTRELESAKDYIQSRYSESPEARYGILASSKDKDLPTFGVDNTFWTVQKVKLGPWFNEPRTSPASCCALASAVREFESQGLELDFTLLAWGSDFIRAAGEWNTRRAAGTRGKVHNPYQLRLNAYRVLLTRGRDGTATFVPALDHMDETFEFLHLCGMELL